ncbi:ABC transporter substrate-binding protein [Chitinimonas sp. BJYL2]|uniref:substrate-binding periplasmic protein n=1 Tax=Chitinimonas sp. BJYL2 TaxID=2976696 RepID=UPI0022B485F9|nr:transporter substrate-binding domain-containing protein [Chitinimonas sp. BJYL2]
MARHTAGHLIAPLLGYVLMLLATGPVHAAATPSASLPVLHVVGDHAPPFRIMEGNQCTGMYCEVMQLLAQRAGYALQFSNVPPKRALKMMELGEADIMLGPNRIPAREHYLHFMVASFPPANKAFYVRPGGPAINGYEDLNGLTISVEAGKVFFEPFDSDRQLKRDPVTDSLTALRKAATGRSDAALLPEFEGDWLIRRNGLNLDKAAWRVPGRVSHIAFSRASPKHAAIEPLEAAFAEMARDGSLKAIISRYQ